MSFGLTPPPPPSYPLIPSLSLIYLCFSCFQVFFPVSRSLSCTFSRRSCCHLFWSCCTLWCWRHGSFVEHVKYRVQKLFPSDGTVVLQKINARDRSFKRFISQLLVSPPSKLDAVVNVDMPLAHCLCPEPEPPQLLPDTCDSTTPVDVPSTTNDRQMVLPNDRLFFNGPPPTGI